MMYSENAVRTSCHVMIRPAERALHVIALLCNIFEANALCKLVTMEENRLELMVG